MLVQWVCRSAACTSQSRQRRKEQANKKQLQEQSGSFEIKTCLSSREFWQWNASGRSNLRGLTLTTRFLPAGFTSCPDSPAARPWSCTTTRRQRRRTKARSRGHGRGCAPRAGGAGWRACTKCPDPTPSTTSTSSSGRTASAASMKSRYSLLGFVTLCWRRGCPELSAPRSHRSVSGWAAPPRSRWGKSRASEGPRRSAPLSCSTRKF